MKGEKMTLASFEGHGGLIHSALLWAGLVLARGCSALGGCRRRRQSGGGTILGQRKIEWNASMARLWAARRGQPRSALL